MEKNNQDKDLSLLKKIEGMFRGDNEMRKLAQILCHKNKISYYVYVNYNFSLYWQKSIVTAWFLYPPVSLGVYSKVTFDSGIIYLIPLSDEDKTNRLRERYNRKKKLIKSKENDCEMENRKKIYRKCRH